MALDRPSFDMSTQLIGSFWGYSRFLNPLALLTLGVNRKARLLSGALWSLPSYQPLHLASPQNL